MKKPNQLGSSVNKVTAAIFLATLAFSSTAFAQGKLLDVYICKDEASAEACSKGCKLKKNTKRSYKINKQGGTVLEVTHNEKEHTSTRSQSNCMIFDERNWDCSYDSTGNYNSKKKLKMTNGVVIKSELVKDTSISGDVYLNASFCAKLN